MLRYQYNSETKTGRNHLYLSIRVIDAYIVYIATVANHIYTALQLMFRESMKRLTTAEPYPGRVLYLSMWELPSLWKYEGYF